MKNLEISKILLEIAAYYEMKDVPFKPRAYQKAALAIESLDEQVADIYKQEGEKGLLKIPGVGKGIADHIRELVKTGKLKKYEAMRKKLPVKLTELTSLEGLGPKKVKLLYRELGIRNLDDLEKAASTHKIRELARFGEKSEQKILASLKFYKGQPGRFLLGYIFPVVERLKKRLQDSGLFERLEVGGSYRRRQETVGDIDVLGVAKKPKDAMDFFTSLKDTRSVVAAGKTKSIIKLDNGIQVDLRLVPAESWGAALQYFTGNKSHNIKLRKIAIGKGYKLSEYGVFKGKKLVAGGTEQEVYKALGMDWMEPELRNDSGEIEAVLRQAQGKPGGLPKVLPYGSVRGDLQVQTNWSDGKASIEEMAIAARDLGREYIAITDHTKTLYMTGMDEKKLLRQMKEIDKLNSTLRLRSGQNSNFRILKSAEVNISKEGKLDIEDKILKMLDMVGVSVHSHFKLPRAEQTKRLVKALSHPEVNVFFHPTTRKIERRAPIDFDFAEILKVCRKNKVALEIDAYPDRLDIHDTLIREALEAGVKFTISTDAHSTKHLSFMHLGEAQARRGWATKDDVLNTRPVDWLLKYFKK